MDTKVLKHHDHNVCVQSAMSTAEKRCAEQGLKLTPVRRRVLEVLLESHRALGAYDVLARLEEEGLGSKPPIAYRALGFLVENGFAHRIESQKAYVACCQASDAHTPAFLICKSCGNVDEAFELSAGLTDSAISSGFQIEQTVIEAAGICRVCQA